VTEDLPNGSMAVKTAQISDIMLLMFGVTTVKSLAMLRHMTVAGRLLHSSVERIISENMNQCLDDYLISHTLVKQALYSVFVFSPKEL
jgi:hypothetical protein